jgi:hypothetical protein
VSAKSHSGKLLALFAVASVLAATSCKFLDSFANVIPPDAMTETAIGETHYRIYLYMKEHRNVPPNLAALPKRQGYANSTVDGWGRELAYSVDTKGVITLSSFGADGKPGGDGLNRDFVHRYETRNPDGSLNIDDEFWVNKEVPQSPR